MGSLEYSFTPKKSMDQEFPVHSLRLSHKYDVDKLAQHYLYTNPDNMFLTLKRHKDVRMQYLRTTRLEYRHEWYNHISIALGIEHNIHEATQYVPFVYSDGLVRQRYTQAGFTARLRFAPGETFYQARSYRIPINMDAPIVSLTQTYMPKGFLGSLHEVNKTELGLQKRFWFSAFGYADVIIRGEKVWSKVAYPDLLMPNVNLSYTIQPESYSLMKPMEFINDQALSWDLTYWGNGILMNRLLCARSSPCADFGGVSVKKTILPSRVESSCFPPMPCVSPWVTNLIWKQVSDWTISSPSCAWTMCGDSLTVTMPEPIAMESASSSTSTSDHK